MAAAAGMRPRRLVLAVTETALADGSEVIATLARLRVPGVRIPGLPGRDRRASADHAIGDVGGQARRADPDLLEPE